VSARGETLAWAAQRATAVVLAVCACVHLATIVWAVRGGLSAAEILGRTRGSAGWAAFYAVFVLALAVHAPIGLRAVAIEWLGWRGASRDWAAVLAGIALAAMGLRAVAAVFA
jgi:succinate dehydrogenase subunit C